MRVRPGLPFLALLFFTLFACNSTVTGGGSGSGGGGGSGSGGGGGSGGGTGGGPGGSGGAWTGGTSGTGSDTLPSCVDGTMNFPVYACVRFPDEEPSGPLPDRPPAAPKSFTGAATVTAVYPPVPGCVYSTQVTHYLWDFHNSLEAMIEVVDSAGTRLILGVVAPGFSPSTIAVGDTLDIDFQHKTVGSENSLQYTLGLRIERAGKLLVAVGSDNPAGLSFQEGPRECRGGWYDCGVGEERIVMQMQDAQGNTVSIPNRKKAMVDDLLVTNARYFENYNLGGCNLAMPIEFLVSAASVP